MAPIDILIVLPTDISTVACGSPYLVKIQSSSLGLAAVISTEPTPHEYVSTWVKLLLSWPIANPQYIRSPPSFLSSCHCFSPEWFVQGPGLVNISHPNTSSICAMCFICLPASRSQASCAILSLLGAASVV